MGKRKRKRRHKSQTKKERQRRHYIKEFPLDSTPEERQKLYEKWTRNELNQNPRKKCGGE